MRIKIIGCSEWEIDWGVSSGGEGDVLIKRGSVATTRRGKRVDMKWYLSPTKTRERERSNRKIRESRTHARECTPSQSTRETQRKK